MPDDADQPRPSPARAAPRVSVVMSVFNVAEYVEASLRSLLNQTMGDFELIVYDDGSTDETPARLRGLADADGRVDLRLRPHGNFVSLLNGGIADARAPYVARADGDDLNEPDRLAKQADFLDAHPDVVAVGSRVREIDPFGVELGVTGGNEQPAGHAEIEAGLLAGNGWALSQPTSMIRADALRRVGAYRPDYRLVEDVDLFLRLAEVGRLANLPEPLVRYRRHAKSVNQQNFEAQRRLFRRLLEESHARRGMAMPDDPAFFRVRDKPIAQLLEQWGWNALRRKRGDAALSHAGQRLRMRPLSWRSWKLWLCAARGW